MKWLSYAFRAARILPGSSGRGVPVRGAPGGAGTVNVGVTRVAAVVGGGAGAAGPVWGDVGRDVRGVPVGEADAAEEPTAVWIGDGETPGGGERRVDMLCESGVRS